jgi:hypothetical protein
MKTIIIALVLISAQCFALPRGGGPRNNTTSNSIQNQK